MRFGSYKPTPTHSSINMYFLHEQKSDFKVLNFAFYPCIHKVISKQFSFTLLLFLHYYRLLSRRDHFLNGKSFLAKCVLFAICGILEPKLPKLIFYIDSYKTCHSLYLSSILKYLREISRTSNVIFQILLLCNSIVIPISVSQLKL